VTFHLGCQAEGIRPVDGGFAVDTSQGTVIGRWVINSAGIHAGRLAQTIDPEAPDLYPCVGEYLILDKQAGESVRMSIYPAPAIGGAGLGVHLTPTTEGNVLLGPSDEYVTDPEQSACTGATADRLLEEAKAMWPALPAHLVIGAYAGIRAKRTPPSQGGFGDFLIRRTPNADHVIHLIGIESPGLTAAPALAEHVVDEILRQAESMEPKSAGEMVRRPWPTRFDELPEEEKERLVALDADYGDIICRCEGVTKAEMLHALDNPLGVRTLTGIKYRCRATMGRCGGGYCLPRMVEILQQEHGWRPEDFLLRGPLSPAFAGQLIRESHD
jgi:glycerol-3-phosphate dehydrogenase